MVTMTSGMTSTGVPWFGDVPLTVPIGLSGACTIAKRVVKPSPCSTFAASAAFEPDTAGMLTVPGPELYVSDTSDFLASLVPGAGSIDNTVLGLAGSRRAVVLPIANPLARIVRSAADKLS